MPCCAPRRLLSAVVACLAMSGCAALSPDGSAPTPFVDASTGAGQGASSQPSASPSAERSTPSARLPARRIIVAGPVQLAVTYSTSLPVARWSNAAIKPLRIVISAVNPRNKKQKIYVKQVAVTVTPYDDAGTALPAVTLSDSSGLNPGYYIQAPSTYNETFVLPAMDSDPVSLDIYLSYEVLLQIDQSSRDYSKQSGEDSFTVALTA